MEKFCKMIRKRIAHFSEKKKTFEKYGENIKYMRKMNYTLSKMREGVVRFDLILQNRK